MSVHDGNDVGDCDDADATDDDSDDASDGNYEDISITHTKEHSLLDAGPLIHGLAAGRKTWDITNHPMILWVEEKN